MKFMEGFDVNFLNFFFFLKSRLFFLLLQSYYWPLLFLLSRGFSGKRRMGRSLVALRVIGGPGCCPGGPRKQVAVLIVLALSSCPSWRQVKSGQEASGLLCPPRLLLHVFVVA